MQTATLSSKGQLTIPKHIRDQLSLREGDRVIATIEDGKIVLYPVARAGVRGLRGAFAGLRPYPGREVKHEAASEARRPVGE
ncbi:MAG: AbrB/MazE/SpoVT family DNA-binding domain-containing protein [Thermomicrobiales bacterium]|nr:AbrB/MazE/SpoVT family DNA-binding domain-containing protein [Thermomicrobiales bacterium]